MRLNAVVKSIFSSAFSSSSFSITNIYTARPAQSFLFQQKTTTGPLKISSRDTDK
jgi:hypothetical protein